MPSLKLAISGGGIASLCIAHALCKTHPDWEIKIFESSPTLREEGAAIGLGSNAQQALALLSPDLRQALDDAGGTKMDPSVRIMMGTGPDSGRHIGDIQPAISQIVVHRTSFWQALRNRIPDNVLQMDKRLTNITLPHDESNTVTLRFSDSSTYTADALIGCDGINSIVRKTVLGPDHPAVSPVYTTGYNHRVVIPLETAIEAFGEDYCSRRTQHGWIGENGFLLTDFVDEGKSMQVVAGWSRGEEWKHEAPFVEWSKDILRADLEGWGDVGTAMTKIFTSQPTLYAAAGRIHLDTPTYWKDTTCVAGDAAQAFPPFQGAGAGQAIEDALVLSTLLGACSSKDDIPLAFQIYDAIRRPRRADVARSSTWAAALFTGQAPGIGLDVERIAQELPKWGSNIYEYDLALAQKEALERMRQKRGP